MVLGGEIAESESHLEESTRGHGIVSRPE
jgi:hypothetical protein